MGGCLSSPVEPTAAGTKGGSGKQNGAKQQRQQVTHDRIIRLLGEAKGEVDKTGNPISFDKILMKFNNQREVLGRIKAIFVEVSNGQPGLSIAGLQTAMSKLHSPLEKKDITDIFEVVDLDDSDVIELKEFLVALTVAHALGLIHLSGSQKGHPEDRKIGKDHEITANDVKNVCNLILSAYLLFDPSGKGFITKAGVEKMIKDGKYASKDSGGRNLMLNESRWKEMDWDSNGEIDFPEFVQAFSGWVNIEEEDFDD